MSVLLDLKIHIVKQVDKASVFSEELPFNTYDERIVTF